MAEPIEIIIRKGTGGEGTGFGVPGANVSENYGRTTKFGTESLSEDQGANRAEKAAIAFALASLKREIGYSISQYGNMTGNYIAQAEIELNIQAINNIASIIGSTIVGAKVGGAYGAITGFAIGATNIAVGYVNQWRTLQVNIAKLDTYSNIMQERSGNSYNNGSRGTNY